MSATTSSSVRSSLRIGFEPDRLADKFEVRVTLQLLELKPGYNVFVCVFNHSSMPSAVFLPRVLIM